MKCRGYVAVLVLLSLAGNSWASEAELDQALVAISAKQFSAAAELLRPLVAGGNAAATYHLAGLHYRGQGVARNTEQARTLYVTAAQAGHGPAQAALDTQWDNAESTLSQRDDLAGPLHAAARRGWVDAVSALLSNGSDIDSRNSEDQTPLMLAAGFGHNETVGRLLAAGASVNLIDKGGETALHKAIRARSDKTADLLVNANANIDVSDEYGNTPLHFATRYEQAQTIGRLLEKGATINATNAEGLTPLSLAARHERSAIRQQLRTAGGTTPFVARAALNRALQQIDNPINGATLWFIAAERGSVATLKRQLARGESLDQTDTLGRSALSIAAARGHLDVVEWLLVSGANPNQNDDDELRPLGHAIWNNELAVAEKLATVTDTVHPTLMDYVMTSGNIETIAWFVDVAARKKLRSRPPLVAAAAAGNEEAIAYLLRAGYRPSDLDADNRSPLWFAAGLGLTQSTQSLIEAGATLDSADRNGDTALHQAAKGGYAALVRTLLTAGARPDAENLQGLTPLMLAANQRHFGVIEQLYLGKADFDYKNTTGQTVLMIAALRNDVSTAGVLLDFGADAGIVNSDRRNAADIATRLGNQDVLNALNAR